MRIVSINSVYAVGSTGKILQNLHAFLHEHEAESIVFYGRGKKLNIENIKKISTETEAYVHSFLSRMSGVDFDYSFFATNKLLDSLRKIKPDVVHLHCLNGHFVNVYKLLKYLKEHDIPTVLTLHAEIMHTAGCEHAYECEKWKSECYNCSKIRGRLSQYFRDDARTCFDKLKISYSGFDKLVVVGVSDWLTDRAKQSAVFQKVSPRFLTINNGVNSKIYFYRGNKEEICVRWAIPARKVVLHVTPNFLHPLKGGQYVLDLAKRMPETIFVIVGYNGELKSKLPNNVITIKHTSNQRELAELYSMADLCLLTSKRETFSMVCAESLCCGTPIVGFKAGGPESIALHEYSNFVDYGNVDALMIKADEMLNKEYNKEDISQKAIERYSNETMCSKYLELYRTII